MTYSFGKASITLDQTNGSQVGMPDGNGREYMVKQTGSVVAKKQKRKRWGPRIHFWAMLPVS